MTEHESFHEACNDYVNSVEDQYVVWLFEAISKAEHKADACGCPSCKSEPRRINGLLGQELDRLAPNSDARQIVLYERQYGRD